MESCIQDTFNADKNSDIVCAGKICAPCEQAFRDLELGVEYGRRLYQSSVHKSSADGCYNCGVLSKHLPRAAGVEYSENAFQFPELEAWNGEIFCSYTDEKSDPKSTGISLHPHDQNDSNCELCTFGHNMIRYDSSESCQQDYLALARAWMENCYRDHAECRSTSGKEPHPPRLICLNDTNFRLVEIREPVAYATLSYCWGNNPTHLTLTTSNMNSFRSGIQDECLPQTFRDAFSFTKALGLPYIWIDALCILQDGPGSLEHWQMHVSLMASIYSQGIVNLCAASSGTAHGGLAAPSGYVALPPVLRLRLDLEDFQTEGRLKTEHCIIKELDHDERGILRSGIDSRGWVYQERVLSPRGIDFEHGNMTWRCVRGRATSLWPFGRIYYKYDLKSNHWQSILALKDRIGSWSKIVGDFSRRHLTRPTDRLPAVA
jgi:hypothetical protein